MMVGPICPWCEDAGLKLGPPAQGALEWSRRACFASDLGPHALLKTQGGAPCERPAHDHPATAEAMPKDLQIYQRGDGGSSLPTPHETPADPAGKGGGEAEPSCDDANDPEPRAPKYPCEPEGGAPGEDLPSSPSLGAWVWSQREPVRTKAETVAALFDLLPDQSRDEDW